MASRAQEDQGLPVMILAWTLLSCTSVIIGLRIYVRRSRLGKLMADDYLMIIAWVFELLGTIFITISWTYGIGRHADTLTHESLAEAMKYTTVGVEPFSIMASTFGRISFCVLLIFVLERTKTWKQTVLWSIVVVQIIINSLIVIQIEAQCATHPAARWKYNPVVAKKYGCEDTDVQAYLGYVQGSINSACDLLLVFMPVVVLWSLQLPTTQKVGVGIMLTLSIFACAASIAKTIFIRTIALGDVTWYISNLNLAQMIENNVVMIAGSIPTLRPLLQRDFRPSRSYSSARVTSGKGVSNGFSLSSFAPSGRSGRSKSDTSHASELQLVRTDDSRTGKSNAYDTVCEPQASDPDGHAEDGRPQQQSKSTSKTMVRTDEARW